MTVESGKYLKMKESEVRTPFDRLIKMKKPRVL